MISWKVRCALVVSLLLLLFSLPSLAQVGNQGSIEGTVLDPSGAAVPNATLTATNEATGQTLTTVSSASGLFRFPVLRVGTYDLTAEASGFAKVTQKGVVVTVGARVNLSFKLPLATQEATVSVTGETPVVETTRSSQSSTVNAMAVSDLPINGRNFIDFVLLTPGVTAENPSTTSRPGDISFAGQRGTLNSLVVDGADNNNTFFGQSLGRTGSGRAPYQFSQEAVQEFQVNSNAYSAELGRAGGAVINVVTKSGTNDFHGSAFWYYRDHGMNASDPITHGLGRPKDPYHINQFGAVLGGPIKKDKAFFFFDYDGQRQTLPNPVFLNLPIGFTPTTTFEQDALDYLTARANSWNRTRDQNVYLGKVDWLINNKNSLSIRYNNQRFTGAGFENGGPQNAFEHTGASLVDTDTLSFALTSTLSPTLVNVARFDYVRDKEPGLSNSINPEATVREAGLVVMRVGRNFFSPRNTTIKRGEWGDTLSYVHGRHSLKFGADFLRDSILNFFPGNFSGGYTFNSLNDFGMSLDGMQAGSFVQAFAGAGTTGPTTKPNNFEFGGFAQDEWRVHPNLTLNFGVRYDIQKIAQPSVLNPDAGLAAAGIRTDHINIDKNNFAPRIGVAWTPSRFNRMVVRAGYGIFYGRTPSILVGTAHSNNGLNVQTLAFGGTDVPTYPNTICGAPVDQPDCPAPAFGSGSAPNIFVFSPNFVEPYVQQGSLGLEFEVGQNSSFSLNYLVAKGTHLTRTRDINLATPQTLETIGIANTSQTLNYLAFTLPRPIAGFARIDQFESAADSIYHGFTAQFSKRFSDHYQFSAAYTLGHVIDTTPDATSVVPFTFDDAKQVENPANVLGDRGNGVDDQRHRFVLSGIWNLDYLSADASPVVRGILGGWQLSGIFVAQSGYPYSGLVNFDLNGDGNSRTDRTPGLGRNTFRTPSNVTLSPRITRHIRLHENLELQLIAEAFNVFNHANVVGVNTTQFSVSSDAGVCGIAGTPCLAPQALFGTPTVTSTDTAGPRIMQLAIKIVF